MNNRGHVQQPYYSNSLAIRQEIQRFESVHPSIYAIYDHLELMPDPLLAQQIREHVVCIEGIVHLNNNFITYITCKKIILISLVTIILFSK